MNNEARKHSDQEAGDGNWCASGRSIYSRTRRGWVSHERDCFLSDQTLLKPAVVIDGGPIGCELAQAFHRLGSTVTLVEAKAQFLSREEPDAADLLENSMRKDGADIRLGTKVTRISKIDGARLIQMEKDGQDEQVEAIKRAADAYNRTRLTPVVLNFLRKWLSWQR